MYRQHRQRPLFILLAIISIMTGIFSSPAEAFDWVPTEEELAKYRQRWNPASHGPVLLLSVDTQAKGQFIVRNFFFGQMGEHSFGNRLGIASERNNGPVHLYAIRPAFTATYGWTDHIEVGLGASFNSFWARQNGEVTTNTGLGDIAFQVKYRPIIQDPDTLKPSVVLFSQVVLPLARWSDAKRPPGGFSPLQRLPNTRVGELSLTQGVMLRKNLEPFRISGGLFYTHAVPGSEGDRTAYVADVVNARLIFEHMLDDSRGFGYNLELSTLHGLSSRADGHAITAGPKNGFSVIGIEPALQWRMGDNWLLGAGVLFTLAGQNASQSIYPNMSIFWVWDKSGKITAL